MRESIRTIALTIGDSNGIGPEIAVKAAVAP
jgi:4-hydroxy-L-threonine phosphate dehydrogenase PdxA